MPVFATREAWQERAAFLRKQILASAGLLPMREKRPLNAQVFGKLERQGYSVEKVLLETLPGFYLGGNLYRPLGQQGPFPGVVSPHGHWAYGRLENTALVSVPGRAMSMARQGYVVFTYDMVGQNDTDQIPHHWSEARHDLWNIGPMGIQLWDSIRATDFVSSLPDVDPARIVATGASGGGTQTFFLMAVDDRIKAAAPVNMISATAQGGVCENAANLRAGWTDFSNMVVGALMAPRPLILISNGGDWTVETPKEVFPAIQSIYRLFGAEKNVANVHFPQFIHNYNKESREAVYQFFNQHILNNPAPVAEAAFRVDFPHELLALHGRSRPANAITGLDQLVENMIRDDRAMTERLQPRDAATLATAREAFAERLTFSLLAFRPKAAELLSEKKSAVPMGEHLVIGRDGKGDRVPAVWLAPVKVNPADRADADRSPERGRVGVELSARQSTSESWRHRDGHRRVPDGNRRCSAGHEQQSVREFQSDQRCQSRPGHSDRARVSPEPFQSSDRQSRRTGGCRCMVVLRSRDGRRRGKSCRRSRRSSRPTRTRST